VKFDDRIDSTRLKFFLARQVDLRRSGSKRTSKRPLTTQQAYLLASSALMEHYSVDDMNQGDVSELLSISPSRLATLTGALVKRGLLRDAGKGKSGSYYRITDDGLRLLMEFTGNVLGTPDVVEAGLRRNNEYREMVTFAEELIDQDLRQKFHMAKEANHEKKGHQR
jgi:DNA-binding PadR family transcriptional regulator